MDPYEELGLKAGATLAQAKKAYRRLAARWHPDRNADPLAVRRMQRINEAYRQVCEWGEAAADEVEASAPAETEPPQQDDAPPPHPNAKRKWWERDWGKPRWEPDGEAAPRPLAHEAEITLEAAAMGCMHRVQGLITDLCPDCEGVGRWVSPRTVCH
ncbi:MAG: J domain-containing protein, partial [Aquabacterium sp.]